MRKGLLFLIFWLAAPPLQASDFVVQYGINPFVNDGVSGQIIRSRVSRETAHEYDVFKLLVQTDNQLKPVVLDNFRTIEGADCFVQDFDFQINPLRIIRKKRSFGDSWIDMQPVTITVYGLTSQGTLTILNTHQHDPACDVRNVRTEY